MLSHAKAYDYQQMCLIRSLFRKKAYYEQEVLYVNRKLIINKKCIQMRELTISSVNKESIQLESFFYE